MKKNFPVTRIYSDAEGETHFEDISIAMDNAGDIGSLSAAIPAKSIIFRETEPGYDYDFHCAPQKQYIILVDAGVEIETSLGDIRVFKAGDILLVEDTTGKGHRSKHTEMKTRRSVFITI